MIKNKLLIKKLNKILLSINKLIESFFNKFDFLFSIKKYKKKDLTKIDNKIVLGFGISVILTLSYFLIPTFYDKDHVKSKLESQISEKFNLEVKFSKEARYGLFPKPHFFTKELLINHEGSEIAITKHAKIYLSIKNFYSIDRLNIKDFFIKKAEFNINSKKVNFFEKILNSNKSVNKIIFKDSNLFYKNRNDEVIFFIKINNLKFSYDEETLENKVLLNYEMFNIPFVLEAKNNLKKRKLLSSLKSKSIRLNIENNLDYIDKSVKGLLDAKIINKKKKFDYELKENLLSFSSSDNKFKGKIDIKPFYLSSDFNFNQIDIKKLFGETSILINLINSEIFNNQNLNANFNIKSEKINGINYISNINLKTFLEEGNIYIRDSFLDWNDAIKINLENVEMMNEESDLKFVGSIIFDFKDLTTFYSYYQIKRNFRKNIKKVKLDFNFFLNQKKIFLDNLKIDNEPNQNVNNYLNDFNSQNKNLFNKVTFRNFIKGLFVNYDG